MALENYDTYSEARDKMLTRTDFRRTPWFVVDADDKKTTRLAVIRHLLSRLDYKKKNKKLLEVDHGVIRPVLITTLN